MNYAKIFIQALVFSFIITIFNYVYNYKDKEPFNLLNSISFFSSFALIYFTLMFVLNKLNSKRRKSQ